ncbi:hypothetical protein EVAR_28756_1 [Eumeta japonica]|uniref:Uncharacterized protein n=1 Tax=Eumeta variegata TaxID=151549 RepID=A0A4C1Z4U8_EUMVA|nr:hypothetical protein EVAR_28756_1 [Eumeta japonica]
MDIFIALLNYHRSLRRVQRFKLTRLLETDWILTEGALIDEFSTRVELTHVLRASESRSRSVLCRILVEVIIPTANSKMPNKAQLPRYRFRSEYLQAHDLQVVVQGDRCWATSPMARGRLCWPPPAPPSSETVAVPLSPRLRHIIPWNRENVLPPV